MPRMLLFVLGVLLLSCSGSSGGSGPQVPQLTAMLKDILTEGATNDSSPRQLVRLGTITLFVATTRAHGAELWKTDGTETGTVQIKDIWPGCDGSSPRFLTVGGGTLYFAAADADHGNELWKSDGTANGTFLAHEFNPGPANSIDAETSFALLGQSLFTGADDGVRGMELWRVSISIK